MYIGFNNNTSMDKYNCLCLIVCVFELQDCIVLCNWFSVFVVVGVFFKLCRKKGHVA